MSEQPMHCILRKVLWGILLGIGGVLTITSVFYFGTSSFVIMFFIGFGCLVPALGMITWAFEPEIDKMKKKRELYKKQQGRELEEEFYAVDADIHHRAIKKRTRSVKQGLAVENCPKCGDKVDANENFCSKCGAKIYTKCSKCQTVNQAGDEFCRNCGNKLND